MNPHRSTPFLRVLGGIAVAGLVVGAVAAPAQAKSKNPPKPKSVSAKATATTVTIKWKSGKGSTTGFNVYKSTKSKVSLKHHVNKKKIKGTSYKVTKLTPNKSYWFVVQSVGSKSSRHSQAKTIKVTTLPTAPGTPSISATAGDRSVRIAWTASKSGNAATSWRVYRTTSATASPVATINLRKTLSGSYRSYTDPYVVNGRTYRYAVVAVNKGGTHTSRTVSALPVSHAPGAPSLTATAGDGVVALHWTASPAGFAPTGYKLYRATTPTGTPLATLAGNVTSYNDTTVTNGASYSYVLVATNASGSATSAVKSATPDYPTPGKPGVTATAGDGHVNLSWTNSTPAVTVTGWDVYRSTETPVVVQPSNLLPAGDNLSGTTLDDTTVDNGETYFYVVVANAAGGKHAQSTEQTAKPVVAPPAKPTLNATPGDHSVALSWSAGVGGGAVDTWDVYRSTTQPVSTNTTPIKANTTSLSYMDGTASNGVTYYYVVVAHNANPVTPSATSDPVSATPAASGPTDLEAVNPSALAGSDAYVMSRLGYTAITSVSQFEDPDNSDALTYFGVTDTATVNVKNNGASSATISVAISNGDFELVGAAPTTIAAGATVSIPVKFVFLGADTYGAETRSATMTVSAAGMGNLVVPLVGEWQPGPNCDNSGASCGSQNITNFEPNIFQVFDAFGWETFPGYELQDNNGTHLSGDEVKGETWNRADTSKPFTVQRIASYSSSAVGRINWYKPEVTDSRTSGRCLNTTGSQGQQDCHKIADAGGTGLGANGSTNPRRSQTLLPDGATTFAVTPDETTFAFQIAGEYSVNVRNNPDADIQDHGCTAACGHHMRFYPVKTATGATVANAYLVAVDLNGVNDDFNDEVLLITNVKPAV